LEDEPELTAEELAADTEHKVRLTPNTTFSSTTPKKSKKMRQLMMKSSFLGNQG